MRWGASLSFPLAEVESLVPFWASASLYYNGAAVLTVLTMETQQTIELLRSGDGAAWEDVITKHQVPLSRYLYNMVRDKGLARDLTQDTFLEAYRAMPTIQGELKLKPWLYRIATNNAIEVLRRRKVISWLPWTEKTPVPWEASNVQNDVAQRELVRGALNEVRSKYRAVLLLHDDQGFTCQEIGQMLSISHDAAKKRLARGRMMFRDAYERSERGGAR